MLVPAAARRRRYYYLAAAATPLGDEANKLPEKYAGLRVGARVSERRPELTRSEAEFHVQFPKSLSLAFVQCFRPKALEPSSFSPRHSFVQRHNGETTGALARGNVLSKAARGAPPEDYERTDGELNWRQRADLASELAAQKHRVSGKNTARGGPT